MEFQCHARSIGRNEIQPKTISGSFTTRIFDCHVASFFRLRCSNLDLYIVTQRCQKPHQSFKRYFREFASQNLRQLRLGSSESPRDGALRQTDRLDRLVQAQNKLGFQKMFFGIGKSQLQPHVPGWVFRCGNPFHSRLFRSSIRSFSRFSIRFMSTFGVLAPVFDFFWNAWSTYTAVSYTHLRAHETVLDLVCRLLLEKKKTETTHRDLGMS